MRRTSTSRSPWRCTRGNVVYNPATLERLVTETSATHIGAEMDPSHLFWQGIDPVEAVDHLGSLVLNAAAKDTRINPAARINGVLDDVGFDRPDPAGPVIELGGGYVLQHVAQVLVLGLRRRRPWARRRLVDRVPAGAGSGSTPTCRSTSSTRTPNSASSRAWRRRPRCCWPLLTAPAE